MKCHAGLAAILIWFAGPVAAFCDDLAALEGDGTAIALPETQVTADCRTSLQLGSGYQTQCGWPFAYRSDEATQAFERLNDAVSACLGPKALITQDQSVNHPDFYDLRMYQIGDREIGVSLKDKAGLQETYVFLRVARTDR